MNLSRRIAELRRDGVPLPESAVLEAVEHPEWDRALPVHDWRAYVPPSLRRTWSSLPLATRLCVFETAELVALGEEVGAPMVTGAATTSTGR